MNKKNLLLLLRPLVISVLYFLMNFILEPVTFLLDIRVFIPLLCAYFLLFILCLFLSGKTLLLAKLISSSFFTVLLTIQTFYIIFFEYGKLGTVAFLDILYYLPIYICFFIWLVEDIKNLRKNKERKEKPILLLFRILVILVIYLVTHFTYKDFISINILIVLFIVIYCILLLISLFLKEKISLVVKLTSTIIITLVFTIEIVFCFYYINRYYEPIVWFIILIDAPGYLLLINWLIKDIKELQLYNEN